MFFLKQSTAANVTLGPFVSASDGCTPVTNLSIVQADVRLTKNGGNFAQANQASNAAHMENGYYSKQLDSADTDTLGRLTVAVAENAALPVWHDFTVVPQNVYDSLVGGTEFLEVTADAPDFNVSGNVLTVKAPDGVTTQLTKTLQTTANAQPITGAD